MQTFFHLNATGLLDSETLATMKVPRCGVPDVNNYRPLGQWNRWSRNTLTYRISTYTSRLPSFTVNSLIVSALKVWSDASPLKFEPAYGPNADIGIKFAKKAHGDTFPFDGPGGTLAHAFGPGEGIGGDVHFDEDEKWTAENTGLNLYLVAAHEFGHSLGLSHSSNPSSLMYPKYKTRKTNGSPLSNEDRQMVTRLYGPVSSSGGMHYPNYPYLHYFFPRWLTADEKCNLNLTFDAITTLGQSIVIFRKRKMWIRQLQTSKVKEGLIKSFLPHIKSDIDAAYEVPSQKTANIFKGSKFWSVTNLKVRKIPTKISELGFPIGVDQIDSAVHIEETGKTLFFIGENYWSYDEFTHTMDNGYPENISGAFPGISGKVDAVFELNDNDSVQRLTEVQYLLS
ncbi:collagenase 3-like [Microcaecilia unicolor]|uniref:Collagenase 3-like n=1 Tax=Microcaecilia unicolor TaxID=1415580 RepID=A0A6P7Y664_9AMPH|nr:collagenase 3-like [Microcaecilia unicolor]